MSFSATHAGSYLDGIPGQNWTAGRPVERLVKIGYVDQEKAPKLFLGFSNRPILDVALATPDAQGGSGLGEFQTGAADLDASFLYGPRIGYPGSKVVTKEMG